MPGMPTALTKPEVEARYAGLRTRADALKATFTQPSMVQFVAEATEDLDDAGQLLSGTAETPAAVLATVDFYLNYAAATVDQLEGVLRKYGKDAQHIG
jgi:hypothetical protein